MGRTRSKVFIVLAAAIGAIVMAFAPGSYAQADQAARPAVSIESTQKDFGEVFAGEELSHIFTVRNTGGAPLELSQTRILGIRRPPSVRLRTISFEPAPANAAPG